MTQAQMTICQQSKYEYCDVTVPRKAKRSSGISVVVILLTVEQYLLTCDVQWSNYLNVV